MLSMHIYGSPSLNNPYITLRSSIRAIIFPDLSCRTSQGNGPLKSFGRGRATAPAMVDGTDRSHLPGASMLKYWSHNTCRRIGVSLWVKPGLACARQTTILAILFPLRNRNPVPILESLNVAQVH